MLKNLKSAFHMIVVAWRERRGRWYYFRDRPDWFVQDMASQSIEPGDDEGWKALVKEAREEHYRRVDRDLRSLESFMREAGYSSLARTVLEVRDLVRRGQ